MPDTKISALSSLSSLASGDLFAVVDVSDGTMAGTGTDKKLSYSDLTTALTTSLGLLTVVSGVRTSATTIGSPATQVEIDVVLSSGIAGGDTLAGGSVASESLTLASTSHTTRGLINLRDQVALFSENKTQSTGSTGLTAFTMSNTVTLSSSTASGNRLIGIDLSPTFVLDGTGAITGSALFNAAGIVKNNTASRNLQLMRGVFIGPTIRGDTGTLTYNWQSFSASPVTDTASGGAGSGGSLVNFASAATVGAGHTIANLKHFQVTDITNAGTVTSQYGIDIPALTGGSTNVGVRNASSTVWPKVTQTITTASDTIAITGTVIRLNNTAGASVTLTSAPTIADGLGAQEQILHIINTSANDVVLQDQGTLAGSNLRLGANTRTLSTRDSIVLLYSPNVGDWCEIGFTNVL